jgi:hypothetical protein
MKGRRGSVRNNLVGFLSDDVLKRTEVGESNECIKRSL